jgi:hypothetical protein
MKLFVTIKEAAELVGISERSAWREVRATGHLLGVPAQRPTPRTVRISRLALEAVAEQVKS